jgi:uncharacterized protein (DUF1501 family)
MYGDLPVLPRLTRRSFFRVGGIGIAGSVLAPAAQPINVQASREVKTRGSAEFVICLLMSGGPSQVDTFDFREGQWTPPDFDLRTVGPNLKLPFGLLPKLAGMTHKYAIVRSCEAWESAHARGQYYIQAGHVFSPARIKEMPSVGSVVAYEMQSHRKDSDFLPPFVTLNYAGATGLVRNGMLPPACSPMAIYTKGDLPFVVSEQDKLTLKRRREFLEGLDAALRQGAVSRGDTMPEYAEFYRASYQILDAPAVASIFKVTPEERQRYGNSNTGDACVIARNLVEANAGTRFITVVQGGWDLHGKAYDKSAKSNQYTVCWEFDSALANLITDLEIRKDKDGKRLLDKTLIVAMGEFGRTPGALTAGAGRDHHRYAAVALFAGAGVLGGKIIGATDEMAAKVVDPGWRHKRSIYPEDVICTTYSALGINWTTKLTGTPSGRPYYYIEDLSPSGPMKFDEITELFA